MTNSNEREVKMGSKGKKSLPFGVYTIGNGEVVISVKRGKLGERVTTITEKWPYYDTPSSSEEVDNG